MCSNGTDMYCSWQVAVGVGEYCTDLVAGKEEKKSKTRNEVRNRIGNSDETEER